MIRMLLKLVASAGVVAALAVGTFVLLERRPALRLRLTTGAETAKARLLSWFPGLRQQDTVRVGAPGHVKDVLSSQREQSTPVPPKPDSSQVGGDVSFANNSPFGIWGVASQADLPAPPVPPASPPAPPRPDPILIRSPEIVDEVIPPGSRTAAQTERERLLRTLDRMRETRVVLTELK